MTKKLAPVIEKLMTTDSSSVKEVGYSKETNLMAVKFHHSNDCVYLYQSVPESIAEEFAEADSSGKYFAANIKGKYICTKMEI